MKKILYLYLGLELAAAILTLLLTLSSSFILALVSFLISLVGIIIPLAVIKNLDNIDEMQTELFRLRHHITQIEKVLEGKAEDEGEPISFEEEFAGGTWECVKCGTVNKEGTAYCSNCKAAYDSYVNPTADPKKKKKLNRWGI